MIDYTVLSREEAQAAYEGIDAACNMMECEYMDAALIADDAEEAAIFSVFYDKMFRASNNIDALYQRFPGLRPVPKGARS